MSYRIIQPPFTLKFREMKKEELKAYFEWFQGVLPKRLDELKGAVQRTPGFEEWQADLTPNSLDLLGEWFSAQVETRLRGRNEIQEIGDRSLFPVGIPEEDLTNRAFSISMDVGMYLSQVFLKNHSSLHWEQSFRNKKEVDYGQPVLVGFGAVPFNPVRMLVTLAYGLVNNQKSAKSLRDLYDCWADMLAS